MCVCIFLFLYIFNIFSHVKKVHGLGLPVHLPIYSPAYARCLKNSPAFILLCTLWANLPSYSPAYTRWLNSRPAFVIVCSLWARKACIFLLPSDSSFIINHIFLNLIMSVTWCAIFRIVQVSCIWSFMKLSVTTVLLCFALVFVCACIPWDEIFFLRFKFLFRFCTSICLAL